MTNLLPQEYGCAYSNEADNVQAEVKVFQHDASVSYNVFLQRLQECTDGARLG